MEMDFTLDVTSMRDLLSALEALPGALAQRVQGAGLFAAASVAAEEARALVPVRTGRLRDSIRVRSVSSRTETLRGVIRVPGGGAQLVAGESYAHLVEFGTVHSAAHPFLGPAALGTTDAQLTAAVSAMKRELPKLERAIRSGRASRTVLRAAGA